MAHTLPEGHDWTEVNVGASETAFECGCGASFFHDLQDGSVSYDEGEGHDEN